jgi:hypothetical protein
MVIFFMIWQYSFYNRMYQIAKDILNYIEIQLFSNKFFQKNNTLQPKHVISIKIKKGCP